MTATYNARPGAPTGTVARARFVRMSATKAREVLDLIRGAEVRKAEEILRFSERDAALVIGKLLRSAVANAEHNDDQIGDDLVVSTCFADEGRTIRRFRPRAKGRASRIRKRTCHITIVVSRMSEEQLERRRNRQAARPGSRASRRAGQEAAEEKAGRSRRRRSRKPSGTEGGAPPQPASRQRREPEPAERRAEDDVEPAAAPAGDAAQAQAPGAGEPITETPPEAADTRPGASQEAPTSSEEMR